MSNKDIYLVAFYSMKPKRHVRTEVAGWMKDPNNISWDERIEITRGQKKNAVNGKILLNLSQKRIEKNGWSDGKEFNDLFKYFFKGYHTYITELMTQLDPEYFSQMLDEMKAEHEAEKANEEATAQ
jgi:ribosomal 50S subunit-associated protein YjgA (DUF615 family)